MPTFTPAQLWQRYRQYLCDCPSLGLTLDISRMHFAESFLQTLEPRMTQALANMDALEAGAIANADEQRMVGHYWLRAPSRAPQAEIRQEIEAALAAVKDFAKKIHRGAIKTPGGKKFANVLVIGIGGSALGPQFVADALASPKDKMRPFFFDNTDPDGMARTLAQIAATPGKLARTLTVVISKSGGTKETRNGMLVVAQAYAAAGLKFAEHAVAITGLEEKSELFQTASAQKWLALFPMWDFVGGRTSELSAVGLLPAALQGFDIDAMLAGARDTDEITRLNHTLTNPAALLAAMWYHAASGRHGATSKDMVILPYSDRLLLFSRYLQQLIMESLGKEKDRQGNVVRAGISVYGNKGSTDQHAYVQQLREGINNFFATFIEVLRDDFAGAARRRGAPHGNAVLDAPTPSTLLVEPDTTAGDYLHGFFQGTRTALASNDRESLTLTVQEISPRTIGILIALFERAVGLYAELIDINAYHQPGVEAGKKAAGAVLALQNRILTHLRAGNAGTAEQIAAALGVPEEMETIHLTSRHLAANRIHRIEATGDDLPQRIYHAV